MTAEIDPPDLLDGNDGPLVGLGELARLLPGRGTAHPSPSCMSRWISRGAVGTDGRRHRLQAIRLGSRWVSTRNALRRFLAALGTAPESSPARATPGVRSPGERNRASEAAAQRLEAEFAVA